MLSSYSNPKIKENRIFALKISSTSEKIITTKDAAGNAVKFENEITINFQVFLNEEFKSNLVIKENFIYDNNSDTTELKTYENQIKTNLTEAAINELLFKLANNL